MFARLHQPKSLSPQELDQYLAQGWFRMGQRIFTTNFLHFHSNFYSALWLRIVLKNFKRDGAQLKIFRRNSDFQVFVEKAVVTNEKEDLYLRYKKSIDFEPSASLNYLLYGSEPDRGIFDTHEVTVYDNNKLIALGYFDVGSTSAAGITSIYDPEYRKFSLGKYLIYLKVEFCLKNNLRYFYPGYFVPGYPSFDYKLTIGGSALEFLQLQSTQWTSIHEFAEANAPFNIMNHKLTTLHNLLDIEGISSKVVKYEFFDANLVPELRDFELFDFPLFLYFTNNGSESFYPIVVFDVVDQQYHIFKCFSVWVPNAANADTEIYSEHVLKIKDEIFATSDAQKLIEKTEKILQREFGKE